MALQKDSLKLLLFDDIITVRKVKKRGIKMIYTVVTAICIAVMAIGVLSVLFNIARKSHGAKLKYIRKFKKGKCTFVFIPAVILYFIGNRYTGKPIFASFFDALGKIVQLVVLKYDTGSVSVLMAENGLFEFAIYFSFTLVALNAVMFALSMFEQNIDYFIEEKRFLFGKKNILLIYGNNPQNIDIYKSDEKNEYRKYIIDDLTAAEKEKLFFSEIEYLTKDHTDDAVNIIMRKSGPDSNIKFTVIVNTGDDEENMNISRIYFEAINTMKAADAVDGEYDLFEKVSIYVFGDPCYTSIYNDLVEGGYGCIHYVNKYQLHAIDFINRYPFTQYMTEKQIDYKNSIVKNGVDINVFMVGFGKTGRQIFLTSVANNQFLTKGDRGIVLKPVNYYLFDKIDTKNDKNLNHNYYRYEHFLDQLQEANSASQYLELPDMPANVHVPRKFDVNDYDFYDIIHRKASENMNDANFVIIAFGTDLENIDMAKKLYEKKNEWAIDNFVIFVKVRNPKNKKILSDIVDSVYVVADDKSVVYNLDAIINGTFTKMARMRNIIYDLEYEAAHGRKLDADVINRQCKKSEQNWFVKKYEFERESSLYCCLSLRSKLHMMGLDYCPKEEANRPALTNQQYLEIYAAYDMPKYRDDGTMVDGKQIIDYPADFNDSRRKNMAIQEHLRWNSFMITKGFIPSSIDQIENEIVDGEFTNGKRYDLRRHGNLTTFDGLMDFRRLVAKKQNKTEHETDVIRYDYQILDDAFWLLDKIGMKIVKREEARR